MLEIRGSKQLGIVLLLMSTALHAQYGGGTGEPNDPYLIYTAEQMNAIGADPNHWDKHFKLMADLDLGEYTGEQFNVIGRVQRVGLVITPFTGVFDGNDHMLSNFTWKSAGRDYVGIFGCVGAPAAEIRNLYIIDPNVTAEGGVNIGSLVGCLASGILTNCSVHGGTIAGGSNVGALAGTVGATLSSGRYKPGSIPIPAGVITDCHTDSNVVGHESVGGMVGSNSGPITDCHADSNVVGDESVGGLVGSNSGAISRCDARGHITGRDLPPDLPAPPQGDAPQGRDSPVVAYSSAIGGLVGSNWGTIADAHTDANVVGSSFVGGLVGDNYAPLTRCCAGGSTTGTSATGNLIGRNTQGIVSDCNSTGTINGGVQAGGLVGSQFGGKLEDCRSSCRVTGQMWVGGLAGSWGGTEITRCHASGAVTGASYVGGLVGKTSGGTITHCGASGTVAGTSFVGGLVGMGYPGSLFDTIEDCYASGAVTGVEWVGGLVGVNGENITASYATGTVRGAERAGGLVGSHEHGTITNCYTRGMVWGTQYLGGLAGSNYGTIVNCYATGLVVGGQTMGGLVALADGYSKPSIVGSFWDMQTTRQPTSAGGIGKSTISMQSAHMFLNAGWDFVGETANGVEDIWWIEEGQDYPRLTWELENASAEGSAP